MILQNAAIASVSVVGIWTLTSVLILAYIFTLDDQEPKPYNPFIQGVLRVWLAPAVLLLETYTELLKRRGIINEEEYS